jgi:hypothetical protein
LEGCGVDSSGSGWDHWWALVNAFINPRVLAPRS